MYLILIKIQVNGGDEKQKKIKKIGGQNGLVPRSCCSRAGEKGENSCRLEGGRRAEKKRKKYKRGRRRHSRVGSLRSANFSFGSRVSHAFLIFNYVFNDNVFLNSFVKATM